MKKTNSIASMLAYLMLFAAGIAVSFLALYGIRADATKPSETAEPVALSTDALNLLRQKADGEELSFYFLEGKTKKDQLAELEAMKAELESAQGATVAEENYEWNLLPSYVAYNWAVRDLETMLNEAVRSNSIANYQGWFDADAEYTKVFATDKRTTDYGSTQVAPLVGNNYDVYQTTYIYDVTGKPGETVTHYYSVVNYWYKPTGSGVPQGDAAHAGWDAEWAFPDGDVSLRKACVLIEWEDSEVDGPKITNMWADVGLDMIGKQKLFTYVDESSYDTMQRWNWIQVNGDITKFFK